MWVQARAYDCSVNLHSSASFGRKDRRITAMPSVACSVRLFGKAWGQRMVCSRFLNWLLEMICGRAD